MTGQPKASPRPREPAPPGMPSSVGACERGKPGAGARAAPGSTGASTPDCLMDRLAGFILSVLALVRDMDDDEADRADTETPTPLWTEFWHRTPETRSMSGALAALKAMLLSDHIDDADERVLRSIVAFLEGKADAATL